jgi:hypothetical protein
MFARIVSVICIAYVAIAMLAAPPGARDVVTATAISADVT